MAMSTLYPGAIGSDVELLQHALFEQGFYSGLSKGVFDVPTEQALIAFQHSRHLVPDGVAGPITLRALGLMGDDAIADPVTGLSVQLTSDMCPDAPLANIRAHLPNVIKSLIAQQLKDRPMVLMAVATIHVESAAFLPISEGQSRYNTLPGGPPFGKYDFRHDLGNGAVGDGFKFRGRGFIQLTGRFNYQKYGNLLTPPIDLVRFPDRANESMIAAELLCLYLKKNQDAIESALAQHKLSAARTLVNGGTYGIAEFTKSYEKGAALMGLPVPAPEEIT